METQPNMVSFLYVLLIIFYSIVFPPRKGWHSIYTKEVRMNLYGNILKMGEVPPRTMVLARFFYTWSQKRWKYIAKKVTETKDNPSTSPLSFFLYANCSFPLETTCSCPQLKAVNQDIESRLRIVMKHKNINNTTNSKQQTLVQ